MIRIERFMDELRVKAIVEEANLNAIQLAGADFETVKNRIDEADLVIGVFQDDLMSTAAIRPSMDSVLRGHWT